MEDDFPYYTDSPTVNKTKRKCRMQSQVQAGVSSVEQAIKRPRGRPPTRRQHLHLPPAMIGQPLPGTPLQLPGVPSCAKCLAKRFIYEPRTFCCGDGAIVLPSYTFPPELTRLYTAPDEKSIYHNIPDLVPNDGGPKYLQLYFYDGQHEAAKRSGCFKELNQDVIDILMGITHSNPYARFFRSLQEIDVNEDTQIHIHKNPVRDQRVSNAPTSDEVAVIWSEDTTLGETSGPHILVTGRTQASHRIMHFYGCYDPLQYPLLFQNGECGWHQGLKKHAPNTAARSRNVVVPPSSFTTAASLLDAEAHRSSQQTSSDERNVSCREYYSYKLQNRPGNMLLRAGRCFQQYVVDMHVKLENTRLDFFRHNQDTIRAELYQGLLDTIDAGEQCAANVGRRVILPATYTGGPRDMKRRYLNAMSLVQRYGKPNFVVTITCNANWPEIKKMNLLVEKKLRTDQI
ncbi:uncharacterized protein LOC141590650 [Silene latifolia]|uniref:uncharacterized protein LOC141590650 n=1 Tax=Silene latifolia TaxID=37657 RepID=UPI003D778C6F